MISFSNINKQYGKQLLFVDASFQLNPGEKVGLVGPNGRARQGYSVWWLARKLPTRARSLSPGSSEEELRSREALDNMHGSAAERTLLQRVNGQRGCLPALSWRL